MGRRLEQYSVYRLVAALAVLGLTTLASVVGTMPGRWEELFAVSGFSLLTLIASMWWARRNPSPALAYVVLAVDAMVTSAIVAATGGIFSLATVMYGAMIAGGAFLDGRIGAGFATALSIGSFAWVYASGATPTVDSAVYRVTAPLSTIFGFVILAFLTPTLFANVRREERAHSERVLESLRSGVLTVSPNGIILAMNPAAELLIGPVVGQAVDKLLPNAAQDLPWEETREDGRRFFCSTSRLPGGERVVVVDDVTEMMRMRERAARDERFVVVGQIAARVAHEIRNPLAALSGALQVVRESPSSRLIDLALREAERLNRLVDDVLDATRPLLTRRITIDIGAIARQVAESFGQDPRFSESVTLHVTGGASPVAVDPDRMHQVLWNLLLNAAQAMPRGGPIHVEVADDPATGLAPAGVRVSVSDRGPGIAPEEAEKLFDPFHTRRTGGLGLGLMVVDQVVRAHGGTVSVLPRAEGGTEIRIWLPREAAVAV